MGNWLSPVQIWNTSILGTSVEINGEYIGATPTVTLNVNTNIENPRMEDGLELCKCVLGVRCLWHEPENADNYAYNATCTLGIAIGIPIDSFGEDVSLDDKNRVLELNALSIGYGKIRSFIEEITSQSSAGRLVIPAIEPFSLLESIAESKEIEKG